jgi:hypothetical protein
MISMLSSKLKVSPASSRIRIFSRVSCNLAAIIAEKKVFDANLSKIFLQKKIYSPPQTSKFLRSNHNFMLPMDSPGYSF